MGVVSSLSTAVQTLKRNPVLFVAGFVVAFVNATVAGGQMLSTGPARIAWSLGTFVVQLGSLVFVVGAYGMTAEALGGTTRLRTLVSAGKKYFADALAATVLVVIAVVATSVVTMVVGLVGFFAVVLGGSGTGFSPNLLAVVMGAIYLLGLLPLFFLQFYLPAVVVSDCSPAESLKQSYRLVKGNFVSTLGFDAVLVAVAAVGSLPTILLAVRQMSPLSPGSAGMGGAGMGGAGMGGAGMGGAGMGAGGPMMYPFAGLSPGTVGIVFALTAVVGTLTGTFFYAYQVAFYEESLLDGAGGENTNGTGGDGMDADDVTPVGTDL
ncbi:hypothetical protein [Halorussus lipolyticus]|uniref:DUF7847 domain-containing protein n=1 Tax=Halorussus lipolyticus TaxID=3034024 RepID=UPI0023E7D1F9|nr:hypothetical protein [Halorussus sp. DT80]